MDCEATSPLTFTSSHQICALVGQSVVLGYLSDYFSVEEPTAEQTRDAYLFATGWWQGLNMFHCQVVVAGCITWYHLLSLPFPPLPSSSGCTVTGGAGDSGTWVSDSSKGWHDGTYHHNSCYLPKGRTICTNFLLCS